MPVVFLVMFTLDEELRGMAGKVTRKHGAQPGEKCLFDEEEEEENEDDGNGSTGQSDTCLLLRRP